MHQKRDYRRSVCRGFTELAGRVAVIDDGAQEAQLIELIVHVLGDADDGEADSLFGQEKASVSCPIRRQAALQETNLARQDAQRGDCWDIHGGEAPDSRR